MGYINHIDRFKIFPFVADAVKNFRNGGYKIFVVTNQSGVARGYFTEDLLNQIHHYLVGYLNENGTGLDGIYYCPHHPEEGEDKYRKKCTCRKPKPGLVNLAVKEHEIDLNKSFMIGDRFKDMIFARNLKMKSAFVLTGYGKGEYKHQKDSWNFMPDIIGSNLLEVSQIISNKTSKT